MPSPHRGQVPPTLCRLHLTSHCLAHRNNQTPAVMTRHLLQVKDSRKDALHGQGCRLLHQGREIGTHEARGLLGDGLEVEAALES